MNVDLNGECGDENAEMVDTEEIYGFINKQRQQEQ
jgi:hypothetical protein